VHGQLALLLLARQQHMAEQVAHLMTRMRKRGRKELNSHYLLCAAPNDLRALTGPTSQQHHSLGSSLEYMSLWGTF
jgi:hypothetical protein